jgi:SET domain-containing protein
MNIQIQSDNKNIEYLLTNKIIEPNLDFDDIHQLFPNINFLINIDHLNSNSFIDESQSLIFPPTSPNHKICSSFILQKFYQFHVKLS